MKFKGFVYITDSFGGKCMISMNPIDHRDPVPGPKIHCRTLSVEPLFLACGIYFGFLCATFWEVKNILKQLIRARERCFQPARIESLTQEAPLRYRLQTYIQCKSLFFYSLRFLKNAGWRTAR